MKLFILSIVLITGGVFAQEPLQPNIIGELDLSSRVEEIKEYHGEVRDLKILAPTIAPEEIDRAVLNKLMQDCLLYTSPSPRDISGSRMPSSA